MKRFFATFLLCAVVVAPIFAQSGLKIYLNGGGSIPSGPSDFTDFWKLGFNVGAALGYPFESGLELVGGINYSRFPIDSDALVEEVLDLVDLGDFDINLDVSGGAISMLSLSSGLKYNIPTSGSVTPIWSGVSAYTFSLSVISP